MENGRHMSATSEPAAMQWSVGGLSRDRMARLAALRCTKFVATTILLLCLLVFAVAKTLEGRWVWLGFVTAFAEAATIGGLADWYAVVALFRRPLGLPIPHTAIIPSNQDRIAETFGRFIEINFLTPESVHRKLSEVDFAAFVADWLSDSLKAEALASFVARLVPKILQAVEDTGLRYFATKQILDQISKVEVASLAAELLSAFTDNRRHQRLFDEFTKITGNFLKDEKALAVLREKIREELPSVFNLFCVDAYLLKQIVASAAALLEEVRADHDHPLRGEFDSFVHCFVDKLRHSPDYSRCAEQVKCSFFARLELKELANNVWANMRLFIEQDVAADQSITRRYLAGLFVEIGQNINNNQQIRSDMNEGFVVALSSFLESQKSSVSDFITEQVKSWDLDQMTCVIEINVGRDLQYVRFNGMLIGGLVGLALYSVELLMLTN